MTHAKKKKEKKNYVRNTFAFRSAHFNGFQSPFSKEPISCLGNYFLHHITAPNFNGKDENDLNVLFFILRIFLSGWAFDFCFWIFISRTQKILPDIFFWNVLFFILDFYLRNKSYCWNFLNCVGCRLENVGCRKNLPHV